MHESQWGTMRAIHKHPPPWGVASESPSGTAPSKGSRPEVGVASSAAMVVAGVRSATNYKSCCAHCKGAEGRMPMIVTREMEPRTMGP